MKAVISIRFLTLHRPDRSPSQRFRFEQYISFLEENGFTCETSFLLNADDDKKFYKAKNYFWKFWILLKSISKRYKEVKSKNQPDIVFIQRECFMLGTTYFERQFSKKCKVVFDFDDSIWLQNVSNANKKLAFLKNAAKTSELIKLSDLIFAGNEYLANYAKKFNNNIQIVPTTIDTEEYKKISNNNNNNNTEQICIGWSGSVTTIQHFEIAIPFLKIIKEKFGDKVYFKVIGDEYYVNRELAIQGVKWCKETELIELSEFDIGIMPLLDDEWAKGKCGLKGLQYMALEIATIMSPVGVNTEIIQQGENGYLASTLEEWVIAISLLIESREHRNMVGSNGRKTVIDNYSVESTKMFYLEAFQTLLDK